MPTKSIHAQEPFSSCNLLSDVEGLKVLHSKHTWDAYKRRQLARLNSHLSRGDYNAVTLILHFRLLHVRGVLVPVECHW